MVLKDAQGFRHFGMTKPPHQLLLKKIIDKLVQFMMLRSALYTFKVNQSLICQGNGRSCHKIHKKSDQKKGLMSHNAVKKESYR